MPTEIFRIAFQSTGGQRVRQQFDQFSRGGAVVDKRMQTLQKRGAAVANSFRMINRTLAVFGAGFAIRGIIDAANEFQTLNNRLALTTNTAAETRTRFGQIFDIAQRSRSSVRATAETFEKMNRALAATGATSGEMLKATETVTKAIALSGGTAEGARGALIQFGQGMIEGFKRGAQEINSIAEQAPALLSALAEGLGFGPGGVGFQKFREAATKGLLDPKKLLDALLKSYDTVNQRFGRMQVTISQAFQKLDNSWIRYIGLTGEASGVTQGFANLIEGLAKNFDAIASGLIGFVGTLSVLKLIKSFGAGGFLGSAAGQASAVAEKAVAMSTPVTIRLDTMIVLLQQIRGALLGEAVAGGGGVLATRAKPRMTLAKAQVAGSGVFVDTATRKTGGAVGAISGSGAVAAQTQKVSALSKAWGGLKNAWALALVPFRALFGLLSRIPLGAVALGVGVLVAQFAEWAAKTREVEGATISNFDEVAIRLEFIKIKIDELKNVFLDVFRAIGEGFVKLVSGMLGFDAVTAGGLQTQIATSLRDTAPVVGGTAVGAALADLTNRLGNAARGGGRELFGNQNPIRAFGNVVGGLAPELFGPGGSLTDLTTQVATADRLDAGLAASEGVKTAGEATGRVFGDAVLNALPGETSLADVRARFEKTKIDDAKKAREAEEVRKAAAEAAAKAAAAGGGTPDKAALAAAKKARDEADRAREQRAKEIADNRRDLERRALDEARTLETARRQIAGVLADEEEGEIQRKNELIRLTNELNDSMQGGNQKFRDQAIAVAEARMEMERSLELIQRFKSTQEQFAEQGLLGFGASRDLILRDRERLQASADEARRQDVPEGQVLAFEAAADQQTTERLTESLKAADLASNTFFGGFRAGLSEVVTATSDVATAFKDITQNMFKGAEDALVDWITKGKTDIRGFIEDILTQLIRLGVRTAIINPLAKGLFGITGGAQATGQAGGGLLGSLFGGLFGGSGGGPNTGGNTAFAPGSQTVSGSGGGGLFGSLLGSIGSFLPGPFGAIAGLAGGLLGGGGSAPLVGGQFTAANQLGNAATARASLLRNISGPELFARGGVIRRPTNAIMGESGPEAVVPLPGGRAVPVEITGGGTGSNVTFIINQAPGDNFTRSMRQVASRRAKDVFGAKR